MFEIFFSACLLADHGKCKDATLPIADPEVSAVHCTMGTAGLSELSGWISAELSGWISAHPKYFIKRFSCRPAGRIANT